MLLTMDLVQFQDLLAYALLRIQICIGGFALSLKELLIRVNCGVLWMNTFFMGLK